MSLKLYNTLVREVEVFNPIINNKVGIYTCGPTVYDHSHVGHWYTYVRIDCLIRLFKILNYDITWVMNITDVGHLVSDADEGEDKLQKSAHKEGRSAWQIADFYTKEFLAGMVELNITVPNKIVKATDHIADQIELIKKIEAKGLTYVINDGVYFNTALFPEYSDFAKLDIDEQQAGKRVLYNNQKRNISDFALWKFSPKDIKRDMEWESPWGLGFPGWHIECSAMSMKYLGETFDIHTGGIDHIPIHHTNEIAQSQSVTGKPLANYWIHSNHVTINNQKISKSLGNSITLNDIKSANIPIRALRLHILESHYRSQSKFSYESLNSSLNRLKSWDAVAVLAWQINNNPNDNIPYLEYQDNILSTLENDINTPQALAIIDESFDAIIKSEFNGLLLDNFKKYLTFIDDMFGLNLTKIPDILKHQKDLIIERELYRKTEKWLESDKVRQDLFNQGIGIKDSTDRTIWFYL